MKKFLIGLTVVAGVGVVGLGLLAAQYEAKIPPGVKVGGIDVGKMSPEQAAFRLRKWWDQERTSPITLSLEGHTDRYSGSATHFGISLDDKKTVEQIETDSFFESLKRSVAGTRETVQYNLAFRQGDAQLGDLEKFVSERVPERSPARVSYSGGTFKRTPEASGFALDKSKVFDAALGAFKNSEIGRIPIIVAEKKVPDELLNEIDEVASEFSTRFSEGKASRSHNIRLAAKSIDGLVLAPGDRFSFNKTVGRRTAERGFQIAGVYKAGKHDVDIGGGICQVSSTLYNACLFANLKVVNRSNHSMPVPYVPLGRDATVDYGTVDLVFENNTDRPIALSSSVSAGTITFRVLGKKANDTVVKLESGPASSWDVGIKEEPDPSLPAGKSKVIEKGSRGHRISTFRVVYQGGQEVKREPLGASIYRGGKKIIAVGTAAAPKPTEDTNEDTPPPLDEHDGV